jgi:hypothetical protein
MIYNSGRAQPQLKQPIKPKEKPAKPNTDLTPASRLYKSLTSPNPSNSSSIAKTKALTRKLGERADDVLKVSPSLSTEQYREDERGARAVNDPKNTRSFRAQLRGVIERREEEEEEKVRGESDKGEKKNEIGGTGWRG